METKKQVKRNVTVGGDLSIVFMLQKLEDVENGRVLNIDKWWAWSPLDPAPGPPSPHTLYVLRDCPLMIL